MALLTLLKQMRQTAGPSKTLSKGSANILARRTIISNPKSFSPKTANKKIGNLSNILNIQARENFGRYLGFLIFKKKKKKTCSSDFQFIVDNLNSKLVGWKTNFLNLAGKAMLTKSSLSSIPTHAMQYIFLPSTIHKIIDKT